MIERDSAIQDILEKRGGTLLLISADDLKKTIKETVSEARRILESEVVNGKGEFLLTSNEVLDRLSISRKTLYNWEHKKREPQNHQTLVILSSSLKIDIAYFLADTVDEKYLFQASRNFFGLPHDS